jgi:hypothetical protein
MKKLILLALVAIVLVGCDGCNPINPPEPPIVKTKQFTIETNTTVGGMITPVKMVVDSGKNATLIVTPSFGFFINEIKVNGTAVSLTSIDPTYHTFALNLYSANSNKKVNVSFKKNLSWYLCNTKWVLDSTYVVIDSVLWKSYDYPQHKDIREFLPNGTYVEYVDGKLVTDNSSKWSIDESTSILSIPGYANFKIIILNEKKLIITYITYQGYLQTSVWIPYPN